MGIESEQVNITTVWSPLLWRVKVDLDSRAHVLPLNGIPTFRACFERSRWRRKGGSLRFPLGQQSLVQLAGEHRDAVHPGVMPEPVAGHADLAAAGLEQHAFIEIRPVLDWGFELAPPGPQAGGEGRP